MRFIWFFEFDPDDAEKISAKNRELDSEMEKSPDKYPKMSPSYMAGPCKGFRILEVDDEEQLIRIVMHFFPEEKWKFIPIFEGAMVSEVYKKMKK
jgi:hypothetical protein